MHDYVVKTVGLRLDREKERLQRVDDRERSAVPECSRPRRTKSRRWSWGELAWGRADPAPQRALELTVQALDWRSFLQVSAVCAGLRAAAELEEDLPALAYCVSDGAGDGHHPPAVYESAEPHVQASTLTVAPLHPVEHSCFVNTPAAQLQVACSSSGWAPRVFLGGRGRYGAEDGRTPPAEWLRVRPLVGRRGCLVCLGGLGRYGAVGGHNPTTVHWSSFKSSRMPSTV